MVRNRPLAAAVASAVTLIATLGITSNQSITKSLVTNTALYNKNDFISYAKRSLLVFSWRFTPLKGNGASEVWRSQVIENVLWVVLTFLAVVVAARGRATLGQVFLGAFTGTVVAAVIAKIIGSFALPRYYRYPQGVSRGVSAVFGAPNGALVFYALCVGVVVGAVVTVITAVSRVKEPDAVAGSGYPGATGGPDGPYGGRSGGIEYQPNDPSGRPVGQPDQPYGAAAPPPQYGADSPPPGYGGSRPAPNRPADPNPADQDAGPYGSAPEGPSYPNNPERR